METAEIGRLIDSLRAASALARQNETGASAVAGADFGQALKSALDRVDAVQQQAGKLQQAFERGEPEVELHQVMIAGQKANIALQTTIQVRNRLVAAYHDIMNMQI